MTNCPECGGLLKFDSLHFENVCETCGLVAERVLSDAPSRNDQTQQSSRPETPNSTFRELPAGTALQRKQNFRLRRTAQRYTWTSRERTQWKHADRIRAEAQRQGIKRPVIAFAVMLSKNVPPRTSMKRRAAATLVVASWAMDHFIDLSKNGWDDAVTRHLTYDLASRSDVQCRVYSAADYISAFSTITIDREPFTVIVLTPSEKVVALFIASSVDPIGSPRVLAGAVINAILRYKNSPVTTKTLAATLGVSVQSILRVEKSLEASLQIESEGVPA
jgi:transcription initiation factor TFIIIB Brf1 subunit/transcription initiation factor TFIIB